MKANVWITSLLLLVSYGKYASASRVVFSPGFLETHVYFVLFERIIHDVVNVEVIRPHSIYLCLFRNSTIIITRWN